MSVIESMNECVLVNLLIGSCVVWDPSPSICVRTHSGPTSFSWCMGPTTYTVKRGPPVFATADREGAGGPSLTNRTYLKLSRARVYFSMYDPVSAYTNGTGATL